jgi:hypothetical protein
MRRVQGNVNQRISIVKAAAVVSSLALVGGYVALHIWGKPPGAPTRVMSSSKLRQIVTPASRPATAPVSHNLLMSSSKSARVLAPQSIPTGVGAEAPTTRENRSITLLPGSKSANLDTDVKNILFGGAPTNQASAATTQESLNVIRP